MISIGADMFDKEKHYNCRDFRINGVSMNYYGCVSTNISHYKYKPQNGHKRKKS